MSNQGSSSAAAAASHMVPHPEFRYLWLGMDFILTITDGNTGLIESVDYPNAYHGVATVSPNTSQIVLITITTPFGTYDGPVYQSSVGQIILNLVADRMDTFTSPFLERNKENISPRQFLRIINSTLNNDL